MEAGSPTEGKVREAVIMLCAGLFMLLAIVAFYDGLVVRRYRIGTDKLDPGQTVRIVLIADLHSCVYGEKKDIVSLIKKQEPDLLVLAGDIVDDRAPLAGAELFAANIRA